MAKIIHKGMWIDIKSLNAEDKKKFSSLNGICFFSIYFARDTSIDHWLCWERAHS
jgi:hypothetical protein